MTTESTNQISYFERRFISVENAVYKAAEEAGIPTRRFLNGIGNQDIPPETLAIRLAERIKELQAEVETLRNPVEPEPKVFLAPSIEYVVSRCVSNYVIPPVPQGATGYRLRSELIEYLRYSTVLVGERYNLIGVKRTTLTEAEWSALMTRIHKKIEDAYQERGLTRHM